VSADGAAAQKALQDFKTQPADILVTVRMAFIGYDCKPITVVGVLTHYRDQGHLMQLVGRGLRVWDDEPFDEQTCHIIAPDDPQMQEFLGQLREEQDEGMRRRQERTRDEDDSSRKPAEHDQLTYIESTDITKIRAVSNDAEADHDQRLLINSAKSHLGMVDDVTKLVAFAELLGQWSKASVPEDVMSVEFPQQPMPDTAQPAPPMTDKQQIEKLNSDTYEQIKAYLADRGITGGRTDYGKFIGKTTKRVNEMAGFSSDEVRTVEDAEARLRAAKTIRGRS
jgi:hypothetical protein